MVELISLMTRVLDRMSGNQISNNQSQTTSNNNWTDPKDTKRRALKAFSSQFSKKLFSGKFEDNWDRHQERFIKSCNEWEIENYEYIDYLQETLKGDALNYMESKIKSNPDLTWASLSKLLSDRYNDINRQKEASDRLFSMRYGDFHTKGESPATTLDRITAYIDKMAVLALPVDRTDQAKARFVSNVTRGQTWAYHAKGRLSTTASYDRVVQAFVQSIRDRADLDEGRQNRGSSSKRNAFQRRDLYNTAKSERETDDKNDNSDEEIFMTSADDETQSSTANDAMAALETFFGSAKFANHPRSLKSLNESPNSWRSRRYNQNRNHLKNNFSNNKNHSASSVDCFKCGRQGCSVATCTQPRDTDRIAKNIGRWKDLRKMQRTARININSVPSLCSSQSEAKEVMVAAVLVNQYQNDNEEEETSMVEEVSDPLIHLNETLQSNVADQIRDALIEGNDTSEYSDPFEIHLSNTTPCNAITMKINRLRTPQTERANETSSPSSSNIQPSTPQLVNAVSLSYIADKASTELQQRYGKEEFAGSCLDTGAQRSVCG